MKQDDAVTVFNGLSFAREGTRCSAPGFAHGAQTAEGEPVAVCGTQALVTLPALGAVTLLFAGGGQSQPRAFAKQLETGVLLQNERVAMQVTGRDM